MARPTLMRHRKFVRLSVALGSEYVARGVLEILWDGAYDSGDDRVGSAEEIEARVRWQGERGALTPALVSSGFVDRIGEDEHVIHDLWHHAPDYVTKRRKRELERSQRVKLTAKRRRVAPSGAETRTSSPQNGSTHSPSPSPAPTLKNVQTPSVSGPAKKPPADTKQFLDWFQTEYAARRNKAVYFVRWDKHSAIVKRLLLAHDLARLKLHATILLTTDEEWVERTDRGVEVLSAKINWLEERLTAWEARRGQASRQG